MRLKSSCQAWQPRALDGRRTVHPHEAAGEALMRAAQQHRQQLPLLLLQNEWPRGSKPLHWVASPRGSPLSLASMPWPHSAEQPCTCQRRPACNVRHRRGISVSASGRTVPALLVGEYQDWRAVAFSSVTRRSSSSHAFSSHSASWLPTMKMIPRSRCGPS